MEKGNPEGTPLPPSKPFTSARREADKKRVAAGEPSDRERRLALYLGLFEPEDEEKMSIEALPPASDPRPVSIPFEETLGGTAWTTSAWRLPGNSRS